MRRPARAARTPGGRALTTSLTLLALGSGASDALSLTSLGTVFTGMMTGNLILLGVSLGHARFADALPAIASIAAFVAGVYAAASWLRDIRAGPSRPWPRRVVHLMAALSAAQAVVLVWWSASGGHPGPPARLALVGLTAAAMGVQSRAVIAIATSGTSTTYLTGTLTTLATELATTGEPFAMRRRLAVIIAAVVGAILETVLLIWARAVAPALPLATTLVVIAITGWRR
ncbi:YoaK family protein [Actinomadura sp. HBU206391]|uniref:YoaK family protein n=1 Tax=Actinomadura sp. HBU206391 TaxID=2731692 RepID=UPI00164FD3A5|nr:YoaK family protein [Actinomadura sp. HBU206391]MBC6460641.1 DUF1275 domain-containing protein [Actinomadura sp. HBU206391]